MPPDLKSEVGFAHAMKNLTAFWRMTGNKYATVGELMGSPEGRAVRELWATEKCAKYLHFSDFIQSSEAAELRKKHFPDL